MENLAFALEPGTFHAAVEYRGLTRQPRLVQGADDGWGRALVSEGSDAAGSACRGREPRGQPTCVRRSCAHIQSGTSRQSQAWIPLNEVRERFALRHGLRPTPRVEAFNILRPDRKRQSFAFDGKPTNRLRAEHEWRLPEFARGGLLVGGSLWEALPAMRKCSTQRAAVSA